MGRLEVLRVWSWTEDSQQHAPLLLQVTEGTPRVMSAGFYDLCSSFPDMTCLCRHVYNPNFVFQSYPFPFMYMVFCLCIFLCTTNVCALDFPQSEEGTGLSGTLVCS